MRNGRAAASERARVKQSICGMSDESLVPSPKRFREITNDPNFYLGHASRMIPGVEISFENGKLTIDLSKLTNCEAKIGESLGNLLGRAQLETDSPDINLTEPQVRTTMAD